MYAVEQLFSVWWHLTIFFIEWEHFPRYWSFVRGIQRPVTRGFDVFFDLHLNKRLSKQSWSWWFETPSRSLWRHCNEFEAITKPAWFPSQPSLLISYKVFYAVLTLHTLHCVSFWHPRLIHMHAISEYWSINLIFSWWNYLIHLSHLSIFYCLQSFCVYDRPIRTTSPHCHILPMLYTVQVWLFVCQ